MKNFGFWAIISGFITVVLIAALVLVIVNFVQESANAEREILLNGGTVYITESGVQRIYIEDAAPPTLNFHQFIFTNNTTGSVFASSLPATPSTYSLNSVIIGGEVRSGTFGRLVSIIHLDEGSYIVEFEPHAGTGNFVLNVDIFGAVGLFVFQIIAISLGLCISVGGLITFLILRFLRKSKNQVQERHWQ